jgi:hydrogenase-1 operon protein HyaE
VDQDNLDHFLQQHQHTLLFFAGDVRRFPESSDLAVILPELAKAFAGSFQIGVVAESDEVTLQKRYGFNHWPTLVLLRGEAYLGAISKLQDWASYCADIQQLLQGETKQPPGFAIPIEVIHS